LVWQNHARLDPDDFDSIDFGIDTLPHDAYLHPRCILALLVVGVSFRSQFLWGFLDIGILDFTIVDLGYLKHNFLNHDYSPSLLVTSILAQRLPLCPVTMSALLPLRLWWDVGVYYDIFRYFKKYIGISSYMVY
jgi:hypothetical protein